MSVLFVGKKNDLFCAQAADFAAASFPDSTIILGARGEAWPSQAEQWQGDYIISYLSPWIIKRETLGRAAKASLNFHTGPPEYPGIGCTNFAIYNQETVYGVTCHHMEPTVDTGPIVAVRRFPLLDSDSVFSLTQRCYAFILTLFYEIAFSLLAGAPLPQAGETWTRRPYTRAELNALCRVTLDMSEEEIARRVRATSYPNMPGAYLTLGGVTFRPAPAPPLQGGRGDIPIPPIKL